MSSTVAWKEPARTITKPRSAKRSAAGHFSAEMESFSKSRVDTRAMVGHIDADETFLGGKEVNKHESKKQHLGRGPVNKTEVTQYLGCGNAVAELKQWS